MEQHIKINADAYDSDNGTLANPSKAENIYESIFHFNVPENAVLLDVGCGNGAYMQKIGCRLVGLDISANNINKARILLPDALFAVGLSERLPFKSQSVDIVLFAAVLHHLSDWREGVSEAVRVLKPGGHIFILESNSIGIAPLLPLIIPFNTLRKILRCYPEHEKNAGRISILSLHDYLINNGMKIQLEFGSGYFLDLLVQALSKRLPSNVITQCILNVISKYSNKMMDKTPHHKRIYQYIMSTKLLQPPQNKL